MRKHLYIITLFAVAGIITGLTSAVSQVSESQAEENGPVIKVGYAKSIKSTPGEMDMRIEDTLLHSLTENSINLGFNRGWHWFEVEVRGLTARDYRSKLEVRTPIIDEITVFQRRGSDWENVMRAGDSYSFDARLEPHRFYQIPLKTTDRDEHVFLIGLNGGGEQLQVDFGLLNPEEMAIRDRNDLLLHGLYFGVLLFVILFNTFLYLVIRERSSLHYVGYITALFVLQLALRGYAFQYLWPDWPYMAQVADPFFASLSIFFLLQFSRGFLNLGELFPTWDKIFRISGYLVAVNTLLALIPTSDSFYFSVLFINTLALLLNITIIPLAWGVLKKGFRPARFFIAAFFVLVLSVFGFVLANFGVVETEFFSDKGLLLGSACEVILLSFAIVDRFKQFKEEAVERLEEMNEMKEKANLVLEEKVRARTEEIVLQKDEIESQKEEIVSSIRYAKRIQSAVLPDETYCRQLFPEHFVYFRPCGIVSGDFYWMGEVETRVNGHSLAVWRVFAVVDCTGHGVPGALMSMMGFNYISDIVASGKWNSPAEILNRLNQQVVKALNGKSEARVRDGMDMALGIINPATREMQFAGANLSLYVLRNGEITRLRGDRKAIGAGMENDESKFTPQSIQLKGDDMVYAFTDGIVDQFGGEKGKKLKISRMRKFLLEIAELPVEEQRKQIDSFFKEWKGDLEQIDDLCVIGLKPIFEPIGNIYPKSPLHRAVPSR